MSDFDFRVGLSSAQVRTFQVGFSAEVETVNGWVVDDLQATPSVFTSIPSGPVLISSLRRSVQGSTIKIAESNTLVHVAQWVVENSNYSQVGLSVRIITVPAGSEYTAFHSLKGPFIAIFVDTETDDFAVQVLGIPDRAPASMLADPDPPFISRGV